MSAHVRGIRIPPTSSWLLAALALAVVAFALLGIVWIARAVPDASGGTDMIVRRPLPVPARSGVQPCLSCGTVVIIRTFDLREEAAKPRFVYRVTLQMDDGSYRTFSQTEPPPFRVGARVRVLNGTIAART